jgi:toxin ParE1/3/4
VAKVDWTFQALEDLAEIDHYLHANAAKYADFVISSVLEVTTQLEQFPKSGRIVPEMNIPSVRELIVLKYRIIYQMPSSDEVNILTIRHSSKPLNTF